MSQSKVQIKEGFVANVQVQVLDCGIKTTFGLGKLVNGQITWVSCELWDEAAIEASEKLNNGDVLRVRGVVKTSTWESDGEMRTRTYLKLQSIHRLRAVQSKAA